MIRRYQVYKGKDEAAAGEGSQKQHASAGAGPVQETSGRGDSETAILLPGIQIYETQGRVLLEGKEVELTDIEFSILCLLGKHRGQIFPIQRLYEHIWEEEYYYGASNTVMVHIRNLRGKIEKDPHNPKIIKNVWGKGYRCE